jgi:hypothetical protein
MEILKTFILEDNGLDLAQFLLENDKVEVEINETSDLADKKLLGFIISGINNGKIQKINITEELEIVKFQLILDVLKKVKNPLNVLNVVKGEWRFFNNGIKTGKALMRNNNEPKPERVQSIFSGRQINNFSQVKEGSIYLEATKEFVEYKISEKILMEFIKNRKVKTINYYKRDQKGNEEVIKTIKNSNYIKQCIIF